DGARGQHVDLEVAARHVVHLLGEIESVLVEDVLLRPRRLPAHRDGPLGLDDRGEAQGGRAGSGQGRAREERAAGWVGGRRRITHGAPPSSLARSAPCGPVLSGGYCNRPAGGGVTSSSADSAGGGGNLDGEAAVIPPDGETQRLLRRELGERLPS